MSCDWLIIGGGIHGVHLAVRLVAEAHVPLERIQIVDPAERLLARWRACSAVTGMTHLRSPAVHHLGVSPWALRQFAGQRRSRRLGQFAPPYSRPSLPLFDRHCDRVVADLDLASVHVRGRAARCAFSEAGVEVALTDGGTLTAQNVVLAMGASDELGWPAWAPRAHPRVAHVFAPDVADRWPSQPETVAVVGGGISAGQIALRLRAEGHRVHLIARHALRRHQFDSDPGWLGPKFMSGFSRTSCPERRRAMITAARHRGSVPPDVQRPLQRAIDQGHVHWHQAGVRAVEAAADRVELTLDGAATIRVDRLLLATGFTRDRPGGALVDGLVDAGLPCAPCGYPLVDASLRWHPRVWVTGPLAELELGPVSRNIAGAREAGTRLVTAIRGH